MVVFPAASNPTIRIRISFLPKRSLNKVAKMFPILNQYLADLSRSWNSTDVKMVIHGEYILVAYVLSKPPRGTIWHFWKVETVNDEIVWVTIFGFLTLWNGGFVNYILFLRSVTIIAIMTIQQSLHNSLCIRCFPQLFFKKDHITKVML